MAELTKSFTAVLAFGGSGVTMAEEGQPLSVSGSWTLVHTVFTLKSARLCYSGRSGGIDFNEAEPPQYSDFAHPSFTIGMTFQVSES